MLLSLLSFWMSFKVTPKKIADILESEGVSEKQNDAFVAPEAVRVACVQLRPRLYPTLKSYLLELHGLVKTAVDSGAQVVVFPEYTGLLALGLVPRIAPVLRRLFGGAAPASPDDAKPDPALLRQLVEAFHHFLYETYLYTFSNLAKLQHVCIAAGTSLFYEDGKLVNRCLVFGPDGEPLGAQEKISAVGFDRALGVVPGDVLEPIPTPLGPLGVVIGTDAYYFECFKILREKGAQLIAAPALGGGVLTDLLRCRANGNGVYVLHACLCGENGGRSGVFSPLFVTPKHDGVVARAEASEPSAVVTRVNLQKLERVLPESEPNPAYLAGDYLHSYRYCGALPQTSEDAAKRGSGFEREEIVKTE